MSSLGVMLTSLFNWPLMLCVNDREGRAVNPYTFGFMAAKGVFHNKLSDISAFNVEIR